MIYYRIRRADGWYYSAAILAGELLFSPQVTDAYAIPTKASARSYAKGLRRLGHKVRLVKVTVKAVVSQVQSVRTVGVFGSAKYEQIKKVPNK